MLAKLVRGMSPSFQNFIISMTTLGPKALEMEQAGVPVEALRLQRGRPSPIALVRTAAAMRRVRPDVVQTWLPHADLLGTLAWSAARTGRLVWNLRSAELDPRDHSSVLRVTMRALAALSRVPAAVVVNSRAGQLAHERIGYRPRRWACIPNGFDTDRFAPSSDARRSVRQELEVDDATPLVGLVARVHPMKDHTTFLQAAGITVRSRPDVRFVLAGRDADTSNAMLATRVHAEGLEDRVFMLGEREDIPRVTAAFDVATCSSYSEGFPNAVGEAMAAGVPCVTTDVGDCRELVGDTGVVVPPRDPQALAGAWLHILSMPPRERAALGASARNRIAERFSIAVVIAKYEQLYRGLARPAA